VTYYAVIVREHTFTAMNIIEISIMVVRLQSFMTRKLRPILRTFLYEHKLYEAITSDSTLDVGYTQ